MFRIGSNEAIKVNVRLLSATNRDLTQGYGTFAVLRYHADGSLDNTFGAGGIVTHPFTPGSDWFFVNVTGGIIMH